MPGAPEEREMLHDDIMNINVQVTGLCSQWQLQKDKQNSWV